MPNELKDKKVAFIVANEGVEQVELTEPWKAVQAAGGEPELIAPRPGKVQAFKHLDKADTFDVDRTTSEISESEYDAVVLPGGVANADKLRMDEPAVKFLRQLMEVGKPLGVICHGAWPLVEADVLRGRSLTSWPSLQTDIRNAGGTWLDAEVHVDHGLVSSRKPDDLPAFCEKIIEEFAEGLHPASQR